MRNLRKGFKGFTLVEVLIVIIIVGILIAALLPRLTGSQQRARDTSRQAAVNQIASAASLLLNDVGMLSGGGNEICISSMTAISGAGVDVSTYLSSLPRDPQTTNDNGGASSVGATACAGSYIMVVATGGLSAVVLADMEGTNGNSADVGTASLTNFQASINAGTDNFAAIVR